MILHDTRDQESIAFNYSDQDRIQLYASEESPIALEMVDSTLQFSLFDDCLHSTRDQDRIQLYA